jgi:hypothetical protein
MYCAFELQYGASVRSNSGTNGAHNICHQAILSNNKVEAMKSNKKFHWLEDHVFNV